MKAQGSWSGIPPLKVGVSELSSNEDKSQALMDAFLPKMADAQEEPLTTRSLCLLFAFLHVG